MGSPAVAGHNSFFSVGCSGATIANTGVSAPRADVGPAEVWRLSGDSNNTERYGGFAEVEQSQQSEEVSIQVVA